MTIRDTWLRGGARDGVYALNATNFFMTNSVVFSYASNALQLLGASPGAEVTRSQFVDHPVTHVELRGVAQTIPFK